MDLDLSQIALRYAGLRIADPGRRARLLASLADEGQLSPVLVVQEGDAHPVLIDGYQRVGALMDLGRDQVTAMALPMGEAEALVFAHRLDASRRHTALEEGWLVRELVDRHGMSLRQVGQRLSRSTSWVSRRISLATTVPVAACEAVREGLVPAHAAAKYLVPLARANPEHCQRLVQRLGQERLSDRQIERLYLCWRRSDAEGRERIVEQPLLALRAGEELMGPVVPQDAGDLLLGDLDALCGIGRRARKRLESFGVPPLQGARKRRLVTARDEAKAVCSSLLVALDGACST